MDARHWDAVDVSKRRCVGSTMIVSSSRRAKSRNFPITKRSDRLNASEYCALHVRTRVWVGGGRATGRLFRHRPGYCGANKRLELSTASICTKLITANAQDWQTGWPPTAWNSILCTIDRELAAQDGRLCLKLLKLPKSIANPPVLVQSTSPFYQVRKLLACAPYR